LGINGVGFGFVDLSGFVEFLFAVGIDKNVMRQFDEGEVLCIPSGIRMRILGLVAIGFADVFVGSVFG